jgi:predicted dehydrogenase
MALEAGKHVYVEKPLATTEADVLTLETLAKSQEKCLMVGHLLLFHPAVRRLRQLIEQGELGTIQSIESVRLNTNPFRPDASVLWDLAPHDLSMMSYVLGGEPLAVQSVRGERTQTDHKIDIAWLQAVIDSPHHGLVESRLHVSWVHPEKQVKLTVRGDRQTAILDDARAENKLLLVDNASPNASAKGVPYLDLEPLRLECQHFLNAMAAGRPPLTHAQHALPLVRLLEDAHHRIL